MVAAKVETQPSRRPANAPVSLANIYQGYLLIILYHRTAFSSLARRTIQPSISHRAKSSNAASGRLINSDIPHKIVTLIQPDGKLASDSVRIASLLREIDQSTEFIELVGERPNPIVRIRDRCHLPLQNATRSSTGSWMPSRTLQHHSILFVKEGGSHHTTA